MREGLISASTIKENLRFTPLVDEGKDAEKDLFDQQPGLLASLCLHLLDGDVLIA